jgi:phosphoglycerate dehydrogenase-like enzyme
MIKAAFFGNSGENLDSVYGKGRRQQVENMVQMYPTLVGQDNFAKHAARLDQVEVVFSTWGMPLLGPAELGRLPALKAVFYAAGSVQAFAEPLLERGIQVFSAWGANGVPVAEFTVAQTVLACKGYFRNTRQCRDPQGRRQEAPFRGRGVFGEVVGLIGMGMIGRMVAERLQAFELEVIACDPFLSDEDAAALGVEKVGMEALFERAYVVSNHLPNLPATQGLLHGGLFNRMRQDATFINTGRGAQVVEAEMVEVLGRRQDLSALLDVTYPEPPVADSALYTLPNVQLSSHIAGSLNDEVVRMADYMIEEFAAWEKGNTTRFGVTLEMLGTMA